MSIYVDDMYRPAKVGNNRPAIWCHMTADTSEELRSFADSLGLRREWVQHPGTWKEHYDVTKAVRAAAVKAGAVEVTMREGVTAMRQRWAAHQTISTNRTGAPQ